ncbi:CARDB protein [Paenibacillus pabuli]|uniref:CARDB protein n=1 Tax=Paenibacillus pabuli TaxID=1472 RepID=A0ABX9BEV5_9BACL|nr:CARDB domain-containing protein [Paenibacillus pabuli]RAI89597.1 CARDB protein [Paenibacillus pabuli]
MRKIKIVVITGILFLSIFTVAFATNSPMIKKFVPALTYDSSGNHLYGYIPVIGQNLERPWQLSRWTASFNFSDKSETLIGNYDVFNVKRKPDDPKFDKDNGFGLTYRSEDGLGSLFDAIMKDQSIDSKQLNYYRKTFISLASDYSGDHPYLYTLENNMQLVRTAGIVQRMGAQFDHNQKLSEENYVAHFNVSRWPELSITQGKQLVIKLSAYGYTERNVRLVAVKKGDFPEMSKVVSLTDGKLLRASDPTYTDTIKFNAKDIVKVLGTEVDIILEDGYGRTAIKSVTLPKEDQNMDYVPTKLTLTDGGQLWIKYRYNGEEIIPSDYMSERGMPMTVKVKIGGAATAEFSLPSMNKSIPKSLKDGQELSYLLGKIEISDAPGKYYIKIDATINNPNHQDRALEAPSKAYDNNGIHGEWLIERKGAENDLIAQSITASPSALTLGQSSTVTAKVKNVGGTDVSNVLIRFIEDGQKTIYETRKTMPANTPITVGGFKWTGDVGIHSLTVVVDPDKEKPDKDRTNNVAMTGCSVGKNGGDAYCDTTKPTASWDVTYPLITGYPTKTRTVSWTDSKGNTRTSSESYVDYSDPIWENRKVTYNEKLTVKAELDTKQGIATDPKKPKDEDRESRGSWEIIPWAKEKKLNPNEVTRAGYGVEIKVQTTYTTDWETKVPKGLEGTAKPIGGELKGPTEVRAYIWDSRGKYVTSIGLAKTSGNDKTATWELPRERFKSKFLDIYERKFYTDVKAPDGEYTFKIVAMHAGQHDLSSCFTKKITIFGSMYDDWQTKRDTSAWY